MGLSNLRWIRGAAENGNGFSASAIFTIVAEILRRQREEDESAADDAGSKENDKKSKE
jgi:hypothetical protein